MKWESLEDKLKDKLTARRPHVDADAIWAAIEPEVDAINRRKKRRGFIWIWWLGAIVASGAIGYYFYTSNNGQLVETKAPASDLSSATITSGGIENHTAQDLVEATANAGSETKISTENANASPINLLNEPAPTASSATSSNPVNSINKQRKNLVEKRPEMEPEMVATNTVSNSSINDFINKESGNVYAIKPEAIHEIPSLSLAYFKAKSDLPKLVLNANPPVEKAPPAPRNHYNFAASMQGSISFIDRELALADTSGQELKKLRNLSEKMLESYQIGIGFTYNHRSGFGLSTGVNYTQINELFESKSTVINVDTIYGIKYLAISLDDDTTAIYGDIPVTTKTTFQKKHYNKLRMVDIPVLAGYEFLFRKATVGLQAGVFVNLKLQAEGQILNSASETIQLEEANIFKPRIGLSYYFGASAGYKLSDNMEAYISPFMRYFPKSFTKDYPLSQRYNLYGANIGIRYRF